MLCYRERTSAGGYGHSVIEQESPADPGPESGDPASSTSSPFDWASLYSKAKRFIERSIRAEMLEDGDEEAMLWRACAFELLVQAALSKISPLLIAHPDLDGTSLLAAAGRIQRASKIRSLSATAAFSRAAKVVPHFDLRVANQIAADRNLELHTGLRPSAAVARDSWLGKYWTQVHFLLAAVDMDLVQFVGPDYEATVEEHLKRNSVLVSERVAALIGRAQERLAKARLPEATRRSQAELVAANERAWQLLGRRDLLGDYVQCPACGQEGRVAGDETSTSEVYYDQDDPTDRPTECGEAITDAFGCETCGLSLDGVDQISSAGLSDTFEFQREFEWADDPMDYPPYDPDSGRD